MTRPSASAWRSTPASMECADPRVLRAADGDAPMRPSRRSPLSTARRSAAASAWPARATGSSRPSARRSAAGAVVGADPGDDLAGAHRPDGAARGRASWTLSAHSRSAGEALAAGVVDDLVAIGTLDRASERPRACCAGSIRTRCAACVAGRGSRAVRPACRASTRSGAHGGDAAPVVGATALAAFARGESPWLTALTTSIDGIGSVTITLDDPAIGERARRSDGPRPSRRRSRRRSRPRRARGRAVGRGRHLLLRRAARRCCCGSRPATVRPADILLPQALLDCPVPVIAGDGGSCDRRRLRARAGRGHRAPVGDESRYGFSFMNLGFTPGMGTTRLCEHVLSPAIVHELLYTGEMRRGSPFDRFTGINHVLPRTEVRRRGARRRRTNRREAARARSTALKRTLSLSRRARLRVRAHARSR